MGVRERREREKELRKNQILDAAKTLLLERGLKGTSVQRIAKKAELGVATIYSYYQNKEDLFSALQQEGLRLLQQGIQKAYQKGKTPGDKIKKWPKPTIFSARFTKIILTSSIISSPSRG